LDEKESKKKKPKSRTPIKDPTPIERDKHTWKKISRRKNGRGGICSDWGGVIGGFVTDQRKVKRKRKDGCVPC